MGINAGKYNRRIAIYKVVQDVDEQGFRDNNLILIMQPYAAVKTTKGFTMIANNSDFEKAYTNFTIRYTQTIIDAYYDSVNSNRAIIVMYNNKKYTVEYLNNINEADVEIEMQCKEVLK